MESRVAVNIVNSFALDESALLLKAMKKCMHGNLRHTQRSKASHCDYLHLLHVLFRLVGSALATELVVEPALSKEKISVADLVVVGSRPARNCGAWVLSLLMRDAASSEFALWLYEFRSHNRTKDILKQQ